MTLVEIIINLQRAIKSLGSYHMVVSDGWVGSLYKCEKVAYWSKPSISAEWFNIQSQVAIKTCGSVQWCHCTCVTGLSEVWWCSINARSFFYAIKSCFAHHCQHLVASNSKKTIPPSKVCDIDFSSKEWNFPNHNLELSKVIQEKLSDEKHKNIITAKNCMDDKQISSNNKEQTTQLQSKCKLWSIHRAGRITESNFKSVIPARLLFLWSKDSATPHNSICLILVPQGGAMNMKWP